MHRWVSLVAVVVTVGVSSPTRTSLRTVRPVRPSRSKRRASIPRPIYRIRASGASFGRADALRGDGGGT
jgi:hypothetical protein